MLIHKKDQALDLRRTSSAPQTESERTSILAETPTSPDSYIEDDERSRGEGEDGDDEVDGDVSPFEKRNLSFQERLEMRPRTSSEGKVKRKKKVCRVVCVLLSGLFNHDFCFCLPHIFDCTGGEK